MNISPIVVVRRKKGMEAEDFYTYWRDVHGPMIAAIPGVRKYSQYHVRSEVAAAEDDPIDGIAELWFESEAAQRAAWATPEYARVVQDEPNLFDMNGHSIHPTMEIRTVVLVA